MSVTQTKGQLDAQIATAITQFDREHMGRGPHVVRAWIIQDMILLRLQGVLTPAEETLARDPEGHHLIKQVRMQLNSLQWPMFTDPHLGETITERVR